MGAVSDILDTTGLFYHMTMQDYERKERKEQAKFSRRVEPNEKTILSSYREIFAKSFDIKLAKKHVVINNRIESYEELFAFLGKIPISECIQPAVALDTYFPCRFIDGNYAWVSRNKNGHHRYFSKRKGTDTVSFDLLDLVEITYGLRTMEAIEKVIELLSIRFMEDVWRKEKKEKHLRNYQFIADFDQNRLERYPYLSFYLKDCASLLEAINAIGTIHISKKEYSYKGENVFFSSGSYLSEFLGSYKQAKVVKLINLFATLGLIEKVPSNLLHPLFLKESVRITEVRNLGNTVSYYVVHPFEQVAEEANKRANRLQKFGIHYSNISKTLLEKVFGTDFAESVYVQTIQKNKKREDRQLRSIQYGLEENFLTLMDMQGFATKQMILDMPLSDFTDKQKKNYLNQIWTYLMEKHECLYMKPSNEMRDQMKLKSAEYVALRKAIDESDDLRWLK